MKHAERWSKASSSQPIFRSLILQTLPMPFGTLHTSRVDDLPTILRALNDRKLKERFADLGGVPMVMTPAEFGGLIADETEKWRKVIQAAKIKPE
jgi:hypothetical protein